MSPPPSVSVVICTRDRPERLRRALDSVLGQEVSDIEVLVVDDGHDAASAWSRCPDPRVRWLRTTGSGVGAARATGLEAARGTYVAYCDDDDEWTPDHLERLIEAFTNEPSLDLVYGDSEWVQDGVSLGVPYSFEFDLWGLAGKNFIFASDVLHRAAAARAAGGFDPTLQAYEDWDLWLRMAGDGRIRHVARMVGRHEWHSGCVSAASPFETRDRVRTRHEPRVARLPRAVPFRPDTWTRGRRELAWCSPVEPTIGHGRVAGALVAALADEGIDIVMAPTIRRSEIDSGWERFHRPWDHWGRLGFYYDFDFRPERMHCERLVTFAMWESTDVPRHHVEGINRTAALHYVPCRQNMESYRAAGVTVPIKVLHHGVDRNRFPELERGDREFFTLGSVGAFTVRKGIDVLIRAFLDEFSPKEPVRLRLKDSATTSLIHDGDPRIEIVRTVLAHDELLAFLRRLDAFVLPSRGEGFGLCGLEAMATGLPVIATSWSGPAEYLDPADSYPLSYRMADPQDNEVHRGEPCWVRFHGRWAEPDYDHLRALMRHVYEHRHEAAHKGQRAAARVRRDFTWHRVARQMIEDLDELAGIGAGA